MADEKPVASGYGYADDTPQDGGRLIFGLNQNVFLKKFEWIPNGGKDGAEQEAAEIIFEINGSEKGWRQFPVTQAYGKNNAVITDPGDVNFKNEIQNLSQKMTHLLGCFRDKVQLQAKLAQSPPPTFKAYIQFLQQCLPKDFDKIMLEIFIQYQWSIPKGKPVSYLEIPNKMKHGRFLTLAQLDAQGNPVKWTENRLKDPSDSTAKALFYTNEAGETHPFVRNGWFMNSNFANQQKDDTVEEAEVVSESEVQTESDAAEVTNDGTPSEW